MVSDKTVYLCGANITEYMFIIIIVVFDPGTLFPGRLKEIIIVVVVVVVVVVVIRIIITVVENW